MHSRRPIAAALTSALVLAALIAGPPVILLGFLDPPHIPTRAELASPGDPVLVVNALLATAWLCWLMFTWSVLAEVVQRLRNAPERAAIRTPFQRLAAHLITTIAISAVAPAPQAFAATSTVAAAPADAPTSAKEDATAKAEAGQQHKTYRVKPHDTLWEIAKRHLGDPMRYREIVKLNEGRVMTDGTTFTSEGWIRPGWLIRMPTDATELEPKHPQKPTAPEADDEPVHVVRQGDSLWNIAERHLRNGKRYGEIFKLNKGRPQPDGRRLTDPGQIETGWHLRLPGRVPSSPPEPPPTAEPVKVLKSVPDAETQGSATPRVTQTPAGLPAPAVPGVSIALPGGGMVGLSFAAGIAIALAAARVRQRVRRRVPEATEAVQVVPVPKPEPAVQAAEEAYRKANEPVADDYDLVKDSFTTEPPATLDVGVRAGENVTMDLPGLNLCLTGPGAEDVARALFVALIAQAEAQRVELVAPRDDAIKLFGDDLETLALHLPGLTLTPTFDDAVTHLASERINRAELLQDAEANDVTELRENRPDELIPALVMVGQLTERDPSYLESFLEDAPRFGIGAVLLGDRLPGARCEVGADFRASAEGDLDGVDLFRLPQQEAITFLRRIAIQHGHKDPATEATGEAAEVPEVEAPEVEVPEVQSALNTARFRLLLLGEVRLEIDGEPIDIPTAKGLEMLVLLAVHPAGQTKEEICAILWPDVEQPQAGYRFHAALSDLRKRLWAASGSNRKLTSFIGAENGTYRIDREHVWIDLWEFHAALADARKATDSETKASALDRAAEVCRGHLADGAPYLWIDLDHRDPLTLASVRALLQLGGIHEKAGRPKRSLEVMEQALALDPINEAAAVAVIRLLTGLGRRDEARLRAQHLTAHLASLDLEPTPETQATLRQLHSHLRG
ncbi:LysM peptidoglycan-binding domain-containing protein [Sphaerimonospora mesophila]|uniref:LysM peptidoglycan-binding domain-containing protein n=1 Tax=Sphaerimonospora mesophila TaxID=37483 RepID=UPI0006E17576